ncbi:hypothetical protein CUA69_20560, partial [Shigella boydii]
LFLREFSLQDSRGGSDIMNEMFTIDGKPNQPVRKMIMGHAKKIGLINLLKDGIKGATAL